MVLLINMNEVINHKILEKLLSFKTWTLSTEENQIQAFLDLTKFLSEQEKLFMLVTETSLQLEHSDVENKETPKYINYCNQTRQSYFKNNIYLLGNNLNKESWVTALLIESNFMKSLNSLLVQMGNHNIPRS